MLPLLCAFLLGFAAGGRAFLPLAVSAWGARAGLLHVEGTWVRFLASAVTPYVLTVLALAELVSDKRPKTPSRKTPAPFAFRLVSGAIVGTAAGTTGGPWLAGLVAGVVGAVAGTLGGAALRGRLARAFGRDLPAALLEDVLVVVESVVAVLALG